MRKRNSFTSRTIARAGNYFKTAVVLASALFELSCGSDVSPPSNSVKFNIPLPAHITHEFISPHINPSIHDILTVPEDTYPVGDSLFRGEKEVTSAVTTDIKEIWKKHEILTELPPPVAILVNVAFRNAYGVDLPSDIKIRLLTNEEYEKLFGDSAAYFLFGNTTLYLRQQELTAGLLGGIYHELGHAMDVLVFGFTPKEASTREHTAWFVHRDLLLESECLLPQIGDNAMTLFPEGYDTPIGTTQYMFTTVSGSLSPYFSLYNHELVPGIWKTRENIMAGETDGNSLAILSTWMVLGMSSDWEIARLTIRLGADKLNQLAETPPSDDQFFLMLDTALFNIYDRLSQCKHGKKTQTVIIEPLAFCISTLDLMRNFWALQNLSMIEPSVSDTCLRFDVNAVMKHCYDCSTK